MQAKLFAPLKVITICGTVDTPLAYSNPGIPSSNEFRKLDLIGSSETICTVSMPLLPQFHALETRSIVAVLSL